MARPLDPFTEHVLELMPAPEEIIPKRMFGGVGLFKEGTMFAIISDEKLYLKTDDINRAEFESNSLPPLTFQKKDGKPVALSYHLCPEEAFQREDTMSPWAKSAIDASLRRKK
ncbi:MAG: TfoX/Sxy family protein [Verrucomicrobiales bacterium]|nr:TfoX/Sxy family protein [Verrucomicrobiales bacterium]